MSSFLIYENNVEILNILLLFLELIFKIWKWKVRKLETPQIFASTTFPYEEFNEHDKIKIWR
jgi:hypothetical protein